MLIGLVLDLIAKMLHVAAEAAHGLSAGKQANGEEDANNNLDGFHGMNG